MALPLIMAAMGAVNGIMDAQMAKANAIIENANLDFNKALLEIDSQDNKNALFKNEGKYRNSSGRMLSKTVTNIGKSGVRMEGSAMKVLAENSANAEINALEYRFNGLREDQRTQVQIGQIGIQKQISGATLKNAQGAGAISALAGGIKGYQAGGGSFGGSN